MSTFIISVGTSILSNPIISNNSSRLINLSPAEIENLKNADSFGSKKFDEYADDIRNDVGNPTRLKSWGVEIVHLQKLNRRENETVYLFVSDSGDGVFSGRLIQAFLGENCQIIYCKNLNPQNKSLLIAGLKDMLNSLRNLEIEEGHVLFSGGYKGVIPLLTMYAQAHQFPMHYLHEKSVDDIEISTTNILSWFGNNTTTPTSQIFS